MGEKYYREDAAERVKKLTEELEPLQAGLKTAREKQDPLYLKRREIMDERRALRRQRRESLLADDMKKAEEIEKDIEKQDGLLDGMEEDINNVESEIEDIEKDIKAIEDELEELMDDYNSGYRKSKGFYININGMDLGKELNKAVSKISEINFDEVGETIGKAVDKAVGGINRSFSDFVHNVKNDPENGDFFFSGSGVLPGGNYGRLNFSGSGRLTGDVKCDSLRASGSIKCDGNIDCLGEVRSSGSVNCSGSVNAASFKTSGSVKIGGGFGGKSIHVSGSLTVETDIKADSIRTRGAVTAGGDCEAEKFFSAGKLRIGGLLNADAIEIHLDTAESTVSSIGCETIEVTRGNITGVMDNLGIKGLGGMLTTESIEGDTIRLENTTAKIVRGRDVYIGNGCNIDVIEYSNKCEVSGNSTIGDTKNV